MATNRKSEEKSEDDLEILVQETQRVRKPLTVFGLSLPDISRNISQPAFGVSEATMSRMMPTRLPNLKSANPVEI